MSIIYARVVLVVILGILAWGEYHTTQQLRTYHDQATRQRTEILQLAERNHATLNRVLARIDQQLRRKGTP